MNQKNPMQMLSQMKNQIKSDPIGFLTQRGAKIPQGMNDPNDIINHLMSTGQISQQRYDQAVRMAQMFKR